MASAFARAAREVELVREPGRETEHADDTRMGRSHRRDRTTHRESDDEGPPSPGGLDGRERVLDTQIEPVPGLDPVPHLGEAQRRELRREPSDQPLERRAPGAGNLRCLAAVRTDDTSSISAPENRTSAPVGSFSVIEEGDMPQPSSRARREGLACEPGLGRRGLGLRCRPAQSTSTFAKTCHASRLFATRLSQRYQRSP